MSIFLFQTTLVTALDIYEDDEPELLLCYNRKYQILLENVFVIVVSINKYCALL
jgi:hypothetical protein